MEYLCCCCSSEGDQKKRKFRIFGRKYKKFNGEDLSRDSQDEYEDRQTNSENETKVTGSLEDVIEDRGIGDITCGYDQGRPCIEAFHHSGVSVWDYKVFTYIYPCIRSWCCFCTLWCLSCQHNALSMLSVKIIQGWTI